MTKVVHCKKEHYDIYIGRPSKWGNPFEIGKDGTRQDVVDKYRAWFINNEDLMASIGELKGKILGCWCHPKACHGDVLAEFAEKYDSMEDTLKHIKRVRELLEGCEKNLVERALVHDDSKLQDPEKSIFDEMTPKLKDSTYGSEEYKGFLKQMKPALDHHYAKNSHHPEHFKNGINGMSLLDLIEMLCDWKAAGERHSNGSMKKSLEINKERFKIGDQLQEILENTVKELKF